MIVAVTPNPALDMTYHVDAFLPGETLRVDGARMRAGGKGVNVARVAHQMGERVLALATAGGPTGRELADDLEASGLDHRLVPVEAPTRRTVAIVDRASGATTIMNERGGALSAAEADALVGATRDELRPSARHAGCLVVSGSLPPGLAESFCADLTRIAHDVGIPAVIDAVGAALLAAADAGADVVKPNRAELTQTTGLSDPVAGARALLERGARLALVSLGADGMLAVTPDAAVHARLPFALDGNPTGAGDAAVAAVAVSLAHGDDDIRVMLAHATAWSAAAVLRPVAGEIADNVAELEQLVTLADA